MTTQAAHPRLLPSPNVPGVVIAYGSCLAAFFLASFAISYPSYFFPQALLAIPIFVLFGGVLVLWVVNRSRLGWLVNLWLMGAAGVRSATLLLHDRYQVELIDASGIQFQRNMLTLTMSIVLAILLLSPWMVCWTFGVPRR